MSRQDDSQLLYNNYMKNAEGHFGVSCKLEYLYNSIAPKKLFVKGFIADEAMVFTNDSYLHDRLFLQEKNRLKRSKNALVDGEVRFGKVMDISEFVKKGYRFGDELPSPYNNVAIIGEGDKYDEHGNVCKRGKTVMICTNDPLRLKDFVGNAIRGISSGTSNVGYMQLSLNNQMVICDHNIMSRGMEFDKFIDKWTNEHPIEKEFEY